MTEAKLFDFTRHGGGGLMFGDIWPCNRTWSHARIFSAGEREIFKMAAKYRNGWGGKRAGAGRKAGGEAPAKVDTRVRKFKISSSAVARDGHTLKTSGWKTDNYLRNPVVLACHDSASIGSVIGRAISLPVNGDDLFANIEFMGAEVNPLAEMTLQMVDQGYLRATSVGFIPLSGRPAKGRAPGSYDFDSQELLEISIVPVGSLPDALLAARSAGIDVTPAREWAPQVFEVDAMKRHSAAGVAKIYPVPAAHAAPFKSFGEQMGALARHASGEPDSRLIRAPLGGGEVDPSTGGFMIADQFVEDLIGSLYEEAVIAPLCDRRTTDKPLATTKIPAIDETSRAGGSRWGGALAYWAAEGASVSATFPRFRQLEFSAKKLICVCVASGELGGDAPMLGTHLQRAFASEMGFKLDAAILAGTAGAPAGILSSPALITVAKENGQTTGTIVAENVSKMWSASPAPCRKRAVWIVNEDCAAQLDKTPGGFSGLYIPAGASGNATPLLKGRPVIEVEQSPALGMPGDIVLADLSQYILVDGGMKTAVSADAFFVSDQLAFRFTLRIDGAPAWASPITSYNGSGQRSPFVALAAR